MPSRPRKSDRPPPSASDRGARASGGQSRSDLAKELDTYSGAVSTQLRTINLGILGLVWLLLLRKEEMAWLAQRIPQKALLSVALVCLVELVLDLAQYLFAEKVVESAFDRASASSNGMADYDEHSFVYRSQLFCYRAKLLLTFAAALACVGLIIGALLAGSGSR
jgi:hypothetical protein